MGYLRVGKKHEPTVDRNLERPISLASDCIAAACIPMDVFPSATISTLGRLHESVHALLHWATHSKFENDRTGSSLAKAFAVRARGRHKRL